MTIEYSERLRSNFIRVASDEHPTLEDIASTASMHTATRSCCGGRIKYAIAFGEDREQFMQRDSLNRFLRRRAP